MKAPGILAVVIVILAAACGSSGSSANPTATVRSSATEIARTAVPTLHDASDETIEFTSVSFVDSHTGWVGGFVGGGNGGAIFKTTDGGRTWARQYRGPKGVASVYFIDAQNGWAITRPNRGDFGVDPFVLLHTTDGGSSWQTVSRYLSFRLIRFFTPTYGRAFAEIDGQSRLVETNDSGRTWVVLLTPVQFSTACFSDPNNGFAAGEDGRVYRTMDGARTWQFSFAAPVEIISPVTERGLTVAGVQCGDGSSIAWAYFGDGGVRGSGVAYRTMNGGTTWSIAAEHNLPALEAVGVSQDWPGDMVKVDARVAYTVSTCEPCGSNRVTVRETADGGVTWSRPVTVLEMTTASDLSFADKSHGWITGRHEDISTTSTPPKIENYPLIMATSDGGKTWIQQYP